MAGKSESRRVEVRTPDDFHHHLRDGPQLASIAPTVAASFANVVVMPNLKPPVRTVDEAAAYRNRIFGHVDREKFPLFNPMMTLYLTNTTTSEEILQAKQSGFVYAVKFYPAGATTNSEFGVTSLDSLAPVFQAMSDHGLLLLIHGEVVDDSVDIFSRETSFLEKILTPLLTAFPKLRVVLEHITTSEAVEYVNNGPENLAATITAHHLLYTKDDLLDCSMATSCPKGLYKLRSPFYYCLPILKSEKDRQALLQAATGGNPKFFAGSDSAPHPRTAKVGSFNSKKAESECVLSCLEGCAAGIYTAHATLELYAEAFDQMNALDKLDDFMSTSGRAFYRLLPEDQPRPVITLEKVPWEVPLSYPFGEDEVVPLRAGETISWRRSDRA